MGSMFRSEEMSLAQLFLQPEAAYFIISEMGESGCVQFRDLNEDVNALQKKFVNEVRRCDELERKLRYIESEVKKDNVKIPDVSELPKAPNPREIIDLEAHLEKTEGDMQDLSQNAVTLKASYLELTELRHVLVEAQGFFNERGEVSGLDPRQSILINAEDSRSLGFIAGVINRERVPGFERMLWRISKGNVFLRQAPINEPLEDPATGNGIYKTVFVAFFQGEQLKTKVKKVCAGYHASIFACPNTRQEREEMLKGVRTRIEDLNMVLNQTKDHRQRVLVSVAKELQNWSIMVSKMKAIYHTLNCFNVDVSKKCLIGECWVPTNDIHIVQKALSDGSQICGSSIPSFLNVIETTEIPPTFNRSNKFTKGFQNLIDSYGVASYREINPALYTIITFPFLFAVMFGDVGHSVIVILAALWMVLSEKKIGAQKGKSEIFSIFFAGRYIILLMGIFSFYTGFIYNDMFSKSMNIFGSGWNNFTDLFTNESVVEKEMLDLYDVDPDYNYGKTAYPFGVDPIWQVAANKIIFLNSFKMKLSIIFGVTHMIFGVCMSTANMMYFKKKVSLLLEFLPQILLLFFLFFYLVVLMFLKWFKYAANHAPDDSADVALGNSCAPNVLVLFINMMLFKENDTVGEHCNQYMFNEQPIIQKVLVFASLICIPVLLLGTPLYIQFTRKPKPTSEANGDINEVNPSSKETTHAHNEEEEEPMSEIYIHQAIHTIEYVLSTVSHTASYLRLWALSLAHAQLSEVLWNMVLQKGLKMGGMLGYAGAGYLFFVFSFWVVCTVGILVLMEGLSAFLHTLRLHWVEFMSKFYSGLGVQFQPFSFKALLEEDEDGD